MLGRGSRAQVHDLIETDGGIHLSMYVNLESNILASQRNLIGAIASAYEQLNGLMSPADRQSFMDPVTSLLTNQVGLVGAESSMNGYGQLAVFRSKKSFRVLRIPVVGDPSSTLAMKFHLKPVLKWLQQNDDFLLLYLSEASARLHRGSQFSFEEIGAVDYQSQQTLSERVFRTLGGAALSVDSVFPNENSAAVLDNWINRSIDGEGKKVFVAGVESAVSAFCERSETPGVVRGATSDPFGLLDPTRLEKAVEGIRDRLESDRARRLHCSLSEFRRAHEASLALTNIFQTVKAACAGRIRKILIAEDVRVPGTFDILTGKVSLPDRHPGDILDELAQIVLFRGGEVVLAPLEKTPNSFPVIALLDSSVDEEQILGDDSFNYSDKYSSSDGDSVFQIESRKRRRVGTRSIKITFKAPQK